MNDHLIKAAWGPAKRKLLKERMDFEAWFTAAGFHAGDKWDDEIYAVVCKANADKEDPTPWKKFNKERYAAGSKRADKFAKKMAKKR